MPLLQGGDDLWGWIEEGKLVADKLQGMKICEDNDDEEQYDYVQCDDAFSGDMFPQENCSSHFTSTDNMNVQVLTFFLNDLSGKISRGDSSDSNI